MRKKDISKISNKHIESVVNHHVKKFGVKVDNICVDFASGDGDCFYVVNLVVDKKLTYRNERHLETRISSSLANWKTRQRFISVMANVYYE